MTDKEEPKSIHVLGQNEPMGQAIQLVSVEQNHDDEISLLDLWLVLAKRRKTLLSIMLVFVGLGVAAALIKSPTYEYSAVLQVGVMNTIAKEGDGFDYIEPPDNVLEKLNKSYIPLALSGFLDKNPEFKSAPKFTASMSKKSSLIALQVKGKEKDAEKNIQLIQDTAGYVQKDHQPQMDIARSRYELDLQKEKIKLARLKNPLTLKNKLKQLEIDVLKNNIKIQNLKDKRLVRVAKQKLITEKKSHQNKLASLADELKRLKSELIRLDEVDRLLEKRITDLTTTINDELKNSKISIADISTGPEAMTALLLDNQIQNNRNQLATYEERLNIKQQSLREELNNKIKANERAQDYHQKLISNINNQLEKLDIDNNQKQKEVLADGAALKLSIEKAKLDHKNTILMQQQKIEAIVYKLKGLRDTQLLTKPMQSLKPVGIGKALIVIISLIAGLFVGVFAVFFLEFLSKVREREQQV